MKRTKETFSPLAYGLMTLALVATMLLCICVGSVAVPLKATWAALWNLPMPEGVSRAIIMNVRLPRVLCVALTGAALSLGGAAMQGLLRNPLAEGSTLGVASGASLGAVLALAFGASAFGGVMGMAMLFAFLSIMLILSLAYVLDKSLSTSSIILIGVIFSMFVSSLLNLVIAFSDEQLKTITFWTMGSLAASNLTQAAILAVALAVCAAALLGLSRELNAFAIGEDNARNVGVNVRRVKLTVLVAVSVLIGVCVSIGGTIGFVGLVVPHMARMLSGANHKRLLPASMFFGAIFLLLADLLSRTVLSPIELPIGVITSLVGAVLFVMIFYRARRGR